MKKVSIFSLLLSALLFLSVSANAEEFWYEQSFDNPADLVGSLDNGTQVPTGWTQSTAWQFFVSPSSWIGDAAHSGSNLLACSNPPTGLYSITTDGIDLVADVQYTIVFWIKHWQHLSMNDSARFPAVELRISSSRSASGPVLASTVAGQRYENWTKISTKYTPSTSGTYYFSFVTEPEVSSNTFFIDDFTIEGFIPDVNPEIILDQSSYAFESTVAGESYTAPVTFKTRRIDGEVSAVSSNADLTCTLQRGTEDSEGLTPWKLTLKLTPSSNSPQTATVTLSAKDAESKTLTVSWAPITVTPVLTLTELHSPAASTLYQFSGSASVTYVTSDRIYIQDNTAGAIINITGLGVNANRGDLLTNIVGTVAVSEGSIIITPITTNWQSTASTPLAGTPLALIDYLLSPEKYQNMLVSINGLKFSNVEAGDVFEADKSYTLTDGYNRVGLVFLENSPLIDTAIPTEELCVTGLSPQYGAGIAPRDENDFNEAQVVVTHVVADMPYLQSFDNYDNDYDGTSYLPVGWTCTGTAPFFTANDPNVPAVTGTYYLATGESTKVRDERLYTPFFKMEGGKAHEISFYLYMPGHVFQQYGGSVAYTDMSVALASEQEASAIFQTIWSVSDTSFPDWQRIEATFTPESTGEYCIVFSLSSQYNYAGDVFIEDLLVRREGQLIRPTADFVVSGWWDQRNGDTNLSLQGQALRCYNKSRYATDYEWEVTGPLNFTSTDENPAFWINRSGNYIIKLTAKNAQYSRTTYNTITVEAVNEEANVAMSNYAPQDTHFFVSYDVPTYETSFRDYISGPNHYYLAFAERCPLPSLQEFTIQNINVAMAAYSRRMGVSDPVTGIEENRNYNVKISLLGETDGRPDESKVFYSRNSHVVEEFGAFADGDRYQGGNIVMPEGGAKVKGTFYVVVEFDDTFPIEDYDSNIPRSYFGFGVSRHINGRTTIYARPHTVPEGCQAQPGIWDPIHYIDPKMEGYGIDMTLWGIMSEPDQNQPLDPIDNEVYPDPVNPPEGGLPVAFGPDGTIVFAARMIDGTLTISNTVAGETLTVYDLNGRAVMSFPANETSTTVDASALSSGLYLVSGTNGTAKVLR